MLNSTYGKRVELLLYLGLTMDNAVVLSYQQPLFNAQVRMGGHDAADSGYRHRVLHEHSCVTKQRASTKQKRTGRTGQGTVYTL